MSNLNPPEPIVNINEFLRRVKGFLEEFNRPEIRSAIIDRSNSRFNQEGTNKLYLALLGKRRTLETYRDEPTMSPFVITANDRININDTLTELNNLTALISPIVVIPPRAVPRGGRKTRKYKRSYRRKITRQHNKKKRTNRRK